MRHPLGYLLARSVVNGARRALRRLRQPQYLVGVVAGLAWLAFVGIRRARRPTPIDVSDAAIAMGAAGALLFAAWGWLFGAGGRALAYTPPEATWLLPAPVRRGALVNVKLLRVQAVVIMNAAVWTLLVPAATAGATARRTIALWCLLSTLALHRIVAGLLRGTAVARGGLLRNAGAVVGGTVFGLGLLVGSGTIAAPESAGAWLSVPLVRAVLWPFAALVTPVIRSGPGDWEPAILVALGILALHFVLVHAAERVAEDSATVQALAHLDAGGAGAGARRSRSAPVVRLAPRGAPALAIAWKNVAMLLRRRLFAWLVGAAVGTALVLVLLERLSPVVAVWVGSFALIWGAFLLVAGPQFLRNDLRGDLEHLEFVRTLPLHGRTLLLAELLAPTVMLSVALWVLLGLAYLGLRHAEDLPEAARQAGTLAGVLAAIPGVAAAVMLVQNAGAVLYPGWTRLTGRSGSAAALGTNLVSVALTTVLTILLLSPALWLAGPLAPSRPVLAGVVLTTMALLECVALAWWLGERVDRLEPREELPS